MAVHSLFRDINMAAVTSFGKSMWSSTKRRFSKNKENTMIENNTMQSSKQRVYNKAEKDNTSKTKRIRKIMINLTKSGRLS